MENLKSDGVGEASLKSRYEDEIERKPLTIKEIDPSDRPQERAIEHGCVSLATADLWALVLRTGQPGKPVTELCREMMGSCGGSLLSLERRDRRQLMEIKGIGITKAIQIEAVMTLIGRYHNEYMSTANKDMTVRTSKDIHQYMLHRNANLPHEEVWVVLLNRRNCIIGSSRVSEGGATSSVFDIKKTIRAAILENAEGVVLCHNHPSGNLVPSSQDDTITRRFREACQAVDLRMLDHVIVTPKGFYSYNDEGRL